MKLNNKALALMIALTAAVASGQGTKSGTAIDNTATATFTDPVTGSAATPVNSNTVTTTVLSRPGFDIVYLDGTDGDSGANPGGNTPETAKSKATVLPGGSLTTAYLLLNTGNTDQTITLAAQANAVYYRDVDGNGSYSSGDTLITGAITLPYDDPTTTVDEGRIQIIQVLTAPATAAAGAVFSASPTGTGQGFDSNTSTVIGSQTESATVLGLQYAAITVITPAVSNSPVTTTTTVTVPTTTTPVPGYTSGNAVITVAADEQFAYPKADADANPDVVTFTNTVNNTGTTLDPVNLFPTDGTGNPIGTLDKATGVFTLPGGVTVQFLDTNGKPLPVGADGLPVLQAPAGQVTSYQTRVTYPDSNSVVNPAPITVTVGMDSGLDAGLTSNDTTVNTIYPPAVQFGDATADLGADPTASPVQTGKPGDTVSFPMDVANLGEYADSFSLSGSVQIPLTNGTTATVPVVYYLGNDRTTPVTNTGAVAANSEVKLVATVTIPADAARTVTGNEPKLQQTATGVYSTIVLTDTNDRVSVSAAGSLAVAKFIQGGNGSATVNGLTATAGYATGNNTALPGAGLNYMIMAKNNYNTEVANFTLTDRVPANTTYASSSCTLSTGGACTTFKKDGVIYTDFNGDGNVTAADVLPQGATVTLLMSVKIN